MNFKNNTMMLRLGMFAASSVLFVLPVDAAAMTGACYLDRSAGGCFERESTSKQQRTSPDAIQPKTEQTDGQSAIAAYNKTSVWRKIVADNGAVYQVDVGHILRYNTGAAEIVVYTNQGGAYDPRNLTRLIFDCQGHYQDQANFGVTEYAAPDSVAGQIGKIACDKPD